MGGVCEDNYFRTTWQEKSHFATMQEADRKDVERAFGVLEACWAIVSGVAMM